MLLIYRIIYHSDLWLEGTTPVPSLEVCLLFERPEINSTAKRKSKITTTIQVTEVLKGISIDIIDILHLRP